MIKRIFYLFALLLLSTSVSIFAGNQHEPSISAASAILYDPLSDTVLYGKNYEVCCGMASTTKIMTALVALEQYDLQQQISIQPEWCGIEGSSMYLKAGEEVTVSELLYGLLLASGNDAATALAGVDPDGSQAFVEKMNHYAMQLGLENTKFENPSGLDGENHYTTALELARLTAEALKNPCFREIVSTKEITTAGRTLRNHNRLLWEADACGVKTGYTKACGRCLVSAKEQNGRMLICVTLNAPDDWADHKALYDYGFSQYRPHNLLGAGDCGAVPLVSSSKTQVRLYCNENYAIWLTDKELAQVKIEICGPRFCYGTIEAGTPYGRLEIHLENQQLFETDVYFAEYAAELQPGKNSFWDWIKIKIRRREP